MEFLSHRRRHFRLRRLLLLLLLGIFASRGSPIQSIYNFGDSISDTGNLIREGAVPPWTPIAFPPYGMNALDQKPTGRCSDGLLMIDHFAKMVGLPLVPPYLNRAANFTNGVNFAVAGATALPRKFFVKKGILIPFTHSSLGVQQKRFLHHMKSICNKQSNCITQKLKHAIFFVGEIGGNDYNYQFLIRKSSIPDVATSVPTVVSQIIQTTKALIDVGATHLVIPGNFPIGCFPVYLTAFRTKNISAYDGDNCLKDLNAFSSSHNEELVSEIAKLPSYSATSPAVKIVYADYYNAFLSILRNPSAAGFDNKSTVKACCGAGGGDYNFRALAMCGYLGTTVCRNPLRFISWDGVHLTGEAYTTLHSKLTSNGTFLLIN